MTPSRVKLLDFKVISEAENGFAYHSKSKGLMVMASIETEKDGKNWLHVSFSRRNKMPDYNDITFIKKHFVGEDRKAIMVFPSKDEHVNIHPYCLHLWCCMDEDVLPDFRKFGMI